MPGALVHIGIGLIGAIIVYFIMHELEFSLAIFIGNLLPDVFKIIFLAFYENSINLKLLITNPMHLPAQLVVNGIDFFVFFFAFFFALGWLLYHFHYIKKKKLIEWSELVLYLAIGYLTHILLDYLAPLVGFGTRVGIWI